MVATAVMTAAFANLPSSSWHCTSRDTLPPMTPRARVLIDPVPVAKASMTPTRSISSPTVSNPADPADEASDAPNRALRRADFRARVRPRTFFTLRVRSIYGQT